MANIVWGDPKHTPPETFTDAVERLQNDEQGVVPRSDDGEDPSTADLVSAGYRYEFLLRRFLAAYAESFENTTPAERTTLDWIYQDVADLLSK